MAVVALVLVSAFLHAAWSVSIKGSSNPLAFNAGQALLTLPIAAIGLTSLERELFTPRLLGFAVGTGISHGLYFYWLSRALERADLTLVYPIVRSTPALLPLLAVPFLGETPSLAGGLGIAVVVAGIWGVQGTELHANRLTAPSLRYAWLTLLATVGYSLSDKAAMAALASGDYRGWLPPALLWFCVLSLTSSCVFLPLALRHVRAAELGRCCARRAGAPRWPWGSASSATGSSSRRSAARRRPTSSRCARAA